jgi:cystinosin
LDCILLSSGVIDEIDVLIYQVFLNIQRKSVVGLSVDFVVLNVCLTFKQTNVKILGFTFYSIYNVLFFSSSEIHEEYHRRHPDSNVGPLVQVNDVFFAIHAAVISTFTLTQVYCWGYTRSRRQLPSAWTWGIVVGSLLAIIILSCVVAATDSRVAEWIDVCYALSYVKLLCTFIKYVPQVGPSAL